MDIGTPDTSDTRARQLRDEPLSGRYPTRGYQQRQPSLERGVADRTDLKNTEHGKRVLRGLNDVEVGAICSVDRRQPYQPTREDLGDSAPATMRLFDVSDLVNLLLESEKKAASFIGLTRMAQTRNRSETGRP
jgi:hypothetical protein